MTSEKEACDVARGLVDIELDLCCSREETDLFFTTGSDDDPSVQRLGRPEFDRRRAQSERLHAERCPVHPSSLGSGGQVVTHSS